MTEIEYQEFVRHCPYDAMGDYSLVSQRSKTENKSEDAHSKLNKPGNLANLI